MSLEPGARLGPYEIVSRLGAGAMGEVYRARDTRLGRDVALKILPAEFAESAERRRRFEQESRSAGALNHPNIVAVYDAGEQDGASYIASELVEGESLRDVIQRGPVPTRKALDLAAQIADGLAAAHAAGIVHRDLKPENIMVSRDGRPKILDFGLARYQPKTMGDATMTVTQPGVIMGTAGYMSPEQVTGAPADARSDIFSFGIILYEILTGKLAFERATSIETMSAILREDPAELPAALPPALQGIVLHCLEKDPARRFQSAQDLAFQLRAQTGGGSIVGAPAIAPLKQRSRIPYAVAAILAAGAVGAMVFILMQSPRGADLAAYRFTPLASDQDPQFGAAWSPDGKNIAYIRDVPGHDNQVMVRSLDAPVPSVLTQASGPHSLFWSPDGARVYFVAGDGISSVSRGGGDKDLLLKGNFAAATLSPDGKSLAYWLTVGEHDKAEPKIWISSPPGSAPRKYEPVVFEANGSFTPVFLQFAPDGRQILASITRGSGAELWLLPFPDGAGAHAKPRRILAAALEGSQVPEISWMPDARHVVLSISSAAQPQARLWIADSQKETLAPLTASVGSFGAPAVSPDGKKIIFDSAGADLDIVEVPLTGGAVRPLLATSRTELFPAWSPKGSQFAYVTDRSGSTQIWLKSSEGWDRPLVTEKDFPDDQTVYFLTLAFSPDGTRLAYSRNSNKRLGEIWISPVAGGSPIRLKDSKGYQLGPTWSPDGKWIAYFSTETGVMKAKVGSDERPVSLGFDDGCENPPQWSPDGQWIACSNNGVVGLVSPDGKTRRSVGHRWGFITWSRDGKQIYLLGRVEDGKWRLGAIDVQTGTEKTIYEYGPEVRFATAFNPAFPMSVSPDGKSFATSVVNVKSDIWMLEGFH